MMMNSTQTHRLMLVDDHNVVRLGVKHVLELEPNILVVAEACNAEEARRLAKSCECDIIVTDLSLPDQDGILLITDLKQILPNVPIIVLTMHGDDRMVVDALKAGASGYLTKNATRAELLSAVEAVASGGHYIQPSVAAPVLKELRKENEPNGDEAITNREREILLLAATGLNNQEIALSLMLSVSTVKTHMRSLLFKLDANDRTQAVLEAVRRGIAPAPRLRD